MDAPPTLSSFVPGRLATDPEERGHPAARRSRCGVRRAARSSFPLRGTAAAAHAGHRISHDHHHVLALRERYEAVLEAVEATAGWATSVRASKPPTTIMGRLDGIEARLRQLRRTVPLETQILELPDGRQVRIPTADEALRSRRI